MKMSPSKEDYIKVIYGISPENQVVSNKEIASKLNISAASVTDMINRLVKENMVNYFPYKGVTLTETGIRTANKLIRKHRILEVFLYEKLGFQWDEIHEEADRLEHASSDLFIERLNAFLNDPNYDPHGEVIPNKDGSVNEKDIILSNLSGVTINDRFQVREVSDQENLLHYLSNKGISLNKSYRTIESDSFDGSLTILDEETKDKITISGKALDGIRVAILQNNEMI